MRKHLFALILFCILLSGCSKKIEPHIVFDEENTFHTRSLIISTTNQSQYTDGFYVSKNFDVPYKIDENTDITKKAPSFSDYIVHYKEGFSKESVIENNIILPSVAFLTNKNFVFSNGQKYYDVFKNFEETDGFVAAQLKLIDMILEDGCRVNLIADGFNYCDVIGIYEYIFTEGSSPRYTVGPKINEYSVGSTIYCSSTLYERLK